MSNPVDFLCFKCKHFDEINGGCSAFPEGIPDEINVDGDHNEPLPEQGNSIVFEPIEPAK